jgi:hypothetical protein
VNENQGQEDCKLSLSMLSRCCSFFHVGTTPVVRSLPPSVPLTTKRLLSAQTQQSKAPRRLRGGDGIESIMTSYRWSAASLPTAACVGANSGWPAATKMLRRSPNGNYTGSKNAHALCTTLTKTFGGPPFLSSSPWWLVKICFCRATTEIRPRITSCGDRGISTLKDYRIAFRVLYVYVLRHYFRFWYRHFI